MAQASPASSPTLRPTSPALLASLVLTGVSSWPSPKLPKSSATPKIPKGFWEAITSKGLLVNRCPQMEVLASEAIGCFFTHCGVVRREEIERCIREVMEGVTSMEIKETAEKWKVLAKQAISEGGSSDRNIEKLLDKLILSKHK